MNFLVYIAIFGWIPVVSYLFSRFDAPKAATMGFILGWMFLPVANIPLPAISTYSKIHAICFAILITAFLKDSDRFMDFQLSIIDLPIFVWCVSPFLSSMANGLGAYDGVAGMRDQTVSVGFPYLIGRLYLTSLENLKELTVWIFIGGLIYIPFCLYEIRMSPNLHLRIYGFFQHSDFSQTIRFGGYRPMVFMNHGIMVGLWMASASLCGIWLYANGILQKVFGSKARIYLIALIITTVLVKSSGALALMVIGLGGLFFTKLTKKSLFIMILLIIPLFYLIGRSSGYWKGDNLLDAVASIEADRAESLRFRFINEDILIAKALQQPIFGWGGWGRSQVKNEAGEDIAVTDGQWIIVLGTTGWVGLGAFAASILLPVILLMSRFPISTWGKEAMAPAAALAILLILFMIDSLLNAMPNPTFLFIAGGLNAVYLSYSKLVVDEEDVNIVEHELVMTSNVWAGRTRFI